MDLFEKGQFRMAPHSNKKISYNAYRKYKDDFNLNRDKVRLEAINTIHSLYMNKPQNNRVENEDNKGILDLSA